MYAFNFATPQHVLIIPVPVPCIFSVSIWCLVSVDARLNVNVALNRSSCQVSTSVAAAWGTYYAKYANDGGHGTHRRNIPCAHTYPATNPWWAVDLGTRLDVHSIQFTNINEDGAYIGLRSIGVCTFVSVSVRTKSRKLLIRNWCDLVGNAPSWTLKVIQSWWHLSLTFNLDNYFRAFLISAICFKYIYIATLFSVRRYIFRISKSEFSFKVMGSKPKSRQRKSGSMQLKTTRWKLLGLDRNICYDNARINLELLPF